MLHYFFGFALLFYMRLMSKSNSKIGDTSTLESNQKFKLNNFVFYILELITVLFLRKSSKYLKLFKICDVLNIYNLTTA